MKKNTLFNYISLNLKTLGNQFKIELDVNQRDQHYLRINLDNDLQSIHLDDEENKYNLVDHHISVYALEDKIPTLSQYHYTAYFKKNASHYQLHVYYNNQETLTIEPVFSIKNEETNAYEIINKPQLNEKFIQLASAHINPVLSQLRKKMDETLHSLISTYENSEATLCSQANDPVKYLRSIHSIESQLKKIIPLVNHEHYARLLNFFIALRKDKEQEALSKTKKSNQQPKKSTLKNNVTHEKPIYNAVSQQKTSKKRTISQDELLQALINNSFEKLCGFNDRSYENQIDLINELNYQITPYILTIDESKYTQKNVINLITLHKKIHSTGTDMLRESLQLKNFNFAEKLSSFYYILSAKDLSFSIQQSDHKLLDFLLTNLDFNLENQPIIIKGKAKTTNGRKKTKDTIYQSAVQCCYSQAMKNKAMKECLNVLIRHGAFLHYFDEQGLPIVHKILSSENHPLHASFAENEEKTLLSVSFYRQLISDLTYYKENANLGEEELFSINDKLNQYKRHKENLQSIASFSGPTCKKLINAGQMTMESLFAQTNLLSKLTSLIQSNPETQELVEQFYQEKNNLVKNLPKNKKRAVADHEISRLDFLHDLISTRPEILENLTTDQINEIFSELLDYIRCQNRLLELNPRNNKKSHTFFPQVVHLDSQEQRMLYKKITEYQKKYDNFNLLKELTQLEEKEAKIQNVLTTLEDMKTSLEGVSKMMQTFFTQFSQKLENTRAISDENNNESSTICDENPENDAQFNDTPLN